MSERCLVPGLLTAVWWLAQVSPAVTSTGVSCEGAPAQEHLQDTPQRCRDLPARLSVR